MLNPNLIEKIELNNTQSSNHRPTDASDSNTGIPHSTVGNRVLTITLVKPCPRCQGGEGAVRPGKGPHAGRLECSECQRFIRWISKKELSMTSGGAK